MSSRRITIDVVLLGALTFWLPDTLLHASHSDVVGALLPFILTALLPLTLFAGLIAVSRRRHLAAGYVAVRMLAGVWLSGGLSMTISASFTGGGFAGPDGAMGGLRLLALSLLPPVTFMMSTYDASLGALILVTISLLGIWLVGLAKRPGAKNTQSATS